MKFTKLTSLVLLSSLLSLSSATAQEIVLYGNVSSLNADGSLSPIQGAYVGIDSDWYNYSDEAGNYEFSFLWNWDGPVAVICEAEGYDTQTATIMPEEEVVELNFILSPSQQEENGIVFGHVYEISSDPNEVIPISGAGLIFSNSVSGDTWTTITGENGGYEISLPEGLYLVSVWADGYLDNNEETVTVIAYEEVEQNFYLQPQDEYDLALHGFVRGPSDDDPTGWMPLPGSQIRATPNDQEEPVYEAVTNEEGFYELPLSSGYYDVTASHEGYQSGFAYVYISSNNENWQDFYLEHSDFQNAGIHGLVYWETPNGNEIFISGAQIRAESSDDNLVYEAATGENGGYEMEVMGNHHYIVTCTAEFEGMELVQVHDIYVGESWAELNFGFGEDLPPPQNAGIHGLVYWETPNGNEIFISGAQIRAESSDDNLVYEAATGENGGYEMEVMGNHHYIVTCTAEFEGMELIQVHDIYVGESWAELNFAFGGEPPMDVLLTGYVFGIEIDVIFPLPGSVVSATPSGPTDPVWETTADDEGQYELYLPPGGYLVTAQHEGYVSVTVDIFIEPNQPNELDFYLEQEGYNPMIYGQVWMITDSGNEIPVNEAFIQAVNEETGIAFDTVTNESGNFEMGVMPYMQYFVSCTLPDPSGTTQVQDVFVVISPVELIFVFGDENFGWLAGHVYDSNPEPFPIPNASVWIENEDHEYETLTNEEGYFEIHAPAGWYALHANALEFEPFNGEIMIYPGEEIIMEIMLSHSEENGTDISYFGGWNLIGIPRNTGDSHIEELFPESIEGTLYGYNMAGYYMETVPATGNGYWLKFWETGSASIYGEPFYEMTLELSTGWNLIAGPSGTVTYNGVIDPDEILVPGTLYRYTESGYELSEMITPGNGYWIKSFESGTITLHVTEDLAKFENQESLVSDANQLKINGQTLYFGNKLNEIEMQSFSLPPAPPEGGVDVRFTGDTKICSEKCEIRIMNPGSLFEFEWNIKDSEMWQLIPVIANEEKSRKAILLTTQNHISLNTKAEKFVLRKKNLSEIPSKFSILSAFPNPFNPVTTLRYDLPEDNFVMITVYDMLGREIAKLVNTTQEAGFKSVQWDATDSMGRPVSAGVYLYQIQAGKFVQTKKMVLLK